jgi:hypothetical protein
VQRTPKAENGGEYDEERVHLHHRECPPNDPGAHPRERSERQVQRRVVMADGPTNGSPASLGPLRGSAANYIASERRPQTPCERIVPSYTNPARRAPRSSRRCPRRS